MAHHVGVLAFTLCDDLNILNPSIYVHNNLHSFLLLIFVGSSIQNYQTPLSPDLLSAQSVGISHLPKDAWVLHFARDAELSFAQNTSVIQPPMLQQNNKVGYASLPSYLFTKCLCVCVCVCVCVRVCVERKIEDNLSSGCVYQWIKIPGGRCRYMVVVFSAMDSSNRVYISSQRRREFSSFTAGYRSKFLSLVTVATSLPNSHSCE